MITWPQVCRAPGSVPTSSKVDYASASARGFAVHMLKPACWNGLRRMPTAAQDKFRPNTKQIHRTQTTRLMWSYVCQYETARQTDSLQCGAAGRSGRGHKMKKYWSRKWSGHPVPSPPGKSIRVCLLYLQGSTLASSWKWESEWWLLTPGVFRLQKAPHTCNAVPLHKAPVSIGTRASQLSIAGCLPFA